MKLAEIKELEGQSITKFYRTQNPSSTFYHEDGLGELKWFELVIEIENQNKYNLGESFIKKWESKLKLVELKVESFDKIKNVKIVELIFEEEFKGVYLKFQNNFVIYHDTSFGSEFTIEKYEEVFNESGKLK